MARIIIWGHKLYTHSHSHIHNGFFRSFQWLGHDVIWVDDSDDVSGLDFSNSIFLTEGQVCANMPRRKDCKYILHNCGEMECIGDRLNIQYLTYDSRHYTEVAPGIHYQDRCMYFPWGSPLIPHEFDEADMTSQRSEDVYFLGTVNPVGIGNYDNVAKFARECALSGRRFIAGGGFTGRTKNKDITYLKGWISEGDQTDMYRKAFMAPAIQGDNQLANGMIPCRLFKAISYGCDGISNNPMAHDFFDNQLVFEPRCDYLYHKADAQRYKDNIQRRRWLFNEVRTKHTYIQRCEAILKVL